MVIGLCEIKYILLHCDSGVAKCLLELPKSARQMAWVNIRQYVDVYTYGRSRILYQNHIQCLANS